MLGIGEFAGLTGLSVKALRHYDEIGVLVPDAVDDASGYRRYGEGQVRDGVIVRTLRDAGVSLPDVRRALGDAAVDQVLRDHRAAVLAARAAEDRAFIAAGAVIAALGRRVEVSERSREAQPYVGVVFPGVDENLTDDVANEAAGRLFVRLQRDGLGPVGDFWTTLRTDDAGGVSVMCCWPTVERVPASWVKDGEVSDVVPARRELVALWRPEPGEDLPEGALHPAVVALFDALAGREESPRLTEVRQIVLGQTAEDFAIEVAITVGA